MDIEMMLRGRGFKFVGETLEWTKERKEEVDMAPTSIVDTSYAQTAKAKHRQGEDGV